MDPSSDFKELFELLNSHAVEYVVVGGYAVAAHGAPRYTQDIDVYVRAVPENAQKVLAALRDFGFGAAGLCPADFEHPGQVVQLGQPPQRIDLITSIEAVSWEQAFNGRLVGEYGGVPVPFLGRRELVANKRAVGRPKDRADLDLLGEEPH